MIGLSFSSKLDWGSYIVFIAETAPMKIGTLIDSTKFLSPKIALYLYKSTIRISVEYCCPVCVRAPSYDFDMLDKLQKLICRVVGLSLGVSQTNVANLSIFYRNYLVDVHLDWLNWFQFHILFFFFTIPRSTVSFLAQLDLEYSA